MHIMFLFFSCCCCCVIVVVVVVVVHIQIDSSAARLSSRPATTSFSGTAALKVLIPIRFRNSLGSSGTIDFRSETKSFS